MNPTQALEIAAFNFIATKLPLTTIPDGQIYKGFENPMPADDMTEGQDLGIKLPCVILECGDIQEPIFRSGLRRGTLMIHVRADGKNMIDANFYLTCEEVFSLFSIISFMDEMSNATGNFSVIFSRITDFGRAVKNGENWESTMVMDIVFGQADL